MISDCLIVVDIGWYGLLMILNLTMIHTQKRGVNARHRWRPTRKDQGPRKDQGQYLAKCHHISIRMLTPKSSQLEPFNIESRSLGDPPFQGNLLIYFHLWLSSPAMILLALKTALLLRFALQSRHRIRTFSPNLAASSSPVVGETTNWVASDAWQTRPRPVSSMIWWYDYKHVKHVQTTLSWQFAVHT